MAGDSTKSERRAPSPRVLVIGGSVGGLAAAHELNAIGADPVVLERSSADMTARGAGIVVQPEIESLLGRLRIPVDEVAVPLRERQQLHRDREPGRHVSPQWMTAWDALHRRMRDALPESTLQFGQEVTGIAQDGPAVTAALASGDSATGDFLIGADGVGSTIRGSNPSPAEAEYAGYVAWRGLLPEQDAPDRLRSLLADRFSLYGAHGTQMLSYLVPGADGDVRPGRRRINWVWYVDTPKQTLDEQLRGRSGRTYTSFLPASDVRDQVRTDMGSLREAILPGPFADLVAASEPFMQPILDLPPGRRVDGRTVLIGDAAGTVRPHTASGTSKAFGDASDLADALRGWDGHDTPPRARLGEWSARRDRHLSDLAGAGIDLARRSQLGQ